MISFLPPLYIPTYCDTALHPAMFGDDGLERLNKTLRQQLSDRGESMQRPKAIRADNKMRDCPCWKARCGNRRRR